MSTAAPLQTQASKPQPLTNSTHAGLLLQRKCACGGNAGTSGECEECARKKVPLQRKSANDRAAGDVPPIVHEVLRSPGQPLDAATRAFMEPRFGHDFSRVRVHADAKAADSARAVNALAYTVGRNIGFGAGQYTPGTAVGCRLMAHELAHVVQQGNTVALQRHSLSPSGGSLEQEASLTAEAIISNKPLPSLSSVSSVVQRQDAGVAMPDAGVAAPDAGVAAPDAGVVVPATSLAGLKAVRVDFKTAGAFDLANCATARSAALGVGVGGDARNAMEMTFRLDGPVPPGTEFDITRTVTDTSWVENGGAWSRVLHTPAGTRDDIHDTDECLIPNARRIFVTDAPGFAGRNPRGAGLGGGVAVSVTATGFVIKLSFAEWVIARNRGLGIGWTRISDPTFTFWHSITSVALALGVWSLVDTPGGQKNEIKVGSISTAGATP